MSEPIKQTDEQNLRQWMEENIRGLQKDRSTASYALEFLKNWHHVLKLQHLLSIAESSVKGAVDRAENALAFLTDLQQAVKEIPQKTERSE